MKKLIILSIVLLLIISGCAKSVAQKNTTGVVEQKKIENNQVFNFREAEFDFGRIKQSGGKVTHYFAFTYNGQNSIKITGVPTSCACTSATVDKTFLNNGDSGILTVTFNPNLHEEPAGKFFKTITLLTDPKLPEMPEVKIWAEIDLDLGKEAYELKSDHEDEEGEEEGGLTSYQSITPEVFSEMMNKKDFTLIDVHIPEQEHIVGTDLFTPYDKIDQLISRLPTDKNAKIVLYCRSGSMSRAAAYQLVEKGYTNVYDLVGGKNAYDEFLKNKISTVDDIIAKNGLHWHAKLAIYIDGKKQDIPGDIGLGFIHQPVHTHEADGTIHLEFDKIVKKDDLRLGVFFKNWNKQFNSQCIFDFCNGGDKKVKMLVNGQENSEFEKYLMRDDDVIEIRYE